MPPDTSELSFASITVTDSTPRCVGCVLKLNDDPIVSGDGIVTGPEDETTKSDANEKGAPEVVTVHVTIEVSSK